MVHKKISMVAGTALAIAGSVTAAYAQKTVKSGTARALNTSFINKNVKPGDSFFRYANGKWFDTATISPTETGVGSFTIWTKA